MSISRFLGFIWILFACVAVLVTAHYNKNQWKWDEDPRQFRHADEMLVCVGTELAGPVQIRVSGTDGPEDIVFSPSLLGQCTLRPAAEVKSLRLMPQYRHMFLNGATIWIGDQQQNMTTAMGAWRL